MDPSFGGGNALLSIKQVLDVGNCGPDHAAITKMLQDRFSVKITQSHSPSQTLQLLESQAFDLVLINRKLDQDYTDGIEIIRKMKSSERFAEIPVMLITNYAEHQDEAEKAGAFRGFGKLELNATETFEKLQPFLT